MKTNTQRLLARVIRKRVIRQGKLKLIKTSDKEGYKVVDGREKKMDTKERIKRKRSSRMTARKMKSNTAAKAKRARSMAKSRRRQ
jgi:hypothetical protein